MKVNPDKKLNIAEGAPFQTSRDSASLSAVIMASGHGKRFGSNKLLADFMGAPLIGSLFKAIPKDLFEKVVVVSIYKEVLNLAEAYGFVPVFNDDTTDDTAATIRLGIENIDRKSTGCIFFTGDQPGLSSDTIYKLVETFTKDSQSICLPVCDGKRGNPVIFPSIFFDDLATLPPGGRGSNVIRAHSDVVREVEISNPVELMDTDFPEDIERIIKALQTFSD